MRVFRALRTISVIKGECLFDILFLSKKKVIISQCDVKYCCKYVPTSLHFDEAWVLAKTPHRKQAWSHRLDLVALNLTS